MHEMVETMEVYKLCTLLKVKTMKKKLNKVILCEKMKIYQSLAITVNKIMINDV